MSPTSTGLLMSWTLLNCFTNPYSVCIAKEENTSFQVSKQGVSSLIRALPLPVLTGVDGTMMTALKAGFQEKFTQSQKPKKNFVV